MRWASSLALALPLAVIVSERAASADQGGHTVGVAVLAFDSEGGADEQAEALTTALRSRVRGAQGWALLEMAQSLPLLTAANKCPIRPTLECQQKIAEQIKSDRYIWGIVSKAGPGQVTAEVHLYQKGKDDVAVKDTYADNLKDPQDEKGLGKIASHLVQELSGQVVGVVNVKALESNSEVVIDGEKHVPLAKGLARLELAAGSHSIEVSSPGSAPTKRTVLVQAGKEQSVDLAAQAEAEADHPFPLRKVIGGASAGVGVVLVAVSVVSFANWLDDRSKGKDEAAKVPNGTEPCAVSGDYTKFCQLDKDATTHSAVAWFTGGLGAAAIGVGAYLFFTDPGPEKATAASRRPRVTRVTPMLGGTNGFMFSGSF